MNKNNIKEQYLKEWKKKFEELNELTIIIQNLKLGD